MPVRRLITNEETNCKFEWDHRPWQETSRFLFLTMVSFIKKGKIKARRVIVALGLSQSRRIKYVDVFFIPLSIFFPKCSYLGSPIIQGFSLSKKAAQGNRQGKEHR